MRAIDADALMERLNRKKAGPANQRYTEGFNDCLMRVRSMVHSAPTLTPPNEWVSVEDTVPDPGERVLATDGIFVGEAYRSSANSWFRHTGFPWRDGVTGRTVRFWMPMPSSPERRPPERQEDTDA